MVTNEQRTIKQLIALVAESKAVLGVSRSIEDIYAEAKEVVDRVSDLLQEPPTDPFLCLKLYIAVYMSYVKTTDDYTWSTMLIDLNKRVNDAEANASRD